ncbi:MAG: thioesterase family protein [Anaerolineales bacterium]
MTSVDQLQPGLSAELKERVRQDQTAPHLGSGDVAVFATPAMVTMVERACAELAQRYLKPEQSTVGVKLEVHHLAPTPVGHAISVAVEVLEVEGNRLRFSARIRDETELVGRVEHTRAVIDRDRFMRRVQAKKTSKPG